MESISSAHPTLWDIREDDLSSDEVRDLIRLHLEGMHEHSPHGGVFALDLSGLMATTVTVWTAWTVTKIAGVGALKDLGDRAGEVKSMRTHPEFLCRGVASALLDCISRCSLSAQFSVKGHIGVVCGRGQESCAKASTLDVRTRG